MLGFGLMASGLHGKKRKGSTSTLINRSAANTEAMKIQALFGDGQGQTEPKQMTEPEALAWCKEHCCYLHIYSRGVGIRLLEWHDYDWLHRRTLVEAVEAAQVEIARRETVQARVAAEYAQRHREWLSETDCGMPSRTIVEQS